MTTRASLFALTAGGCNDTQEGCWFIGHPFRGETTTEKDVRYEPNGSGCTIDTTEIPNLPKCSANARKD